MKKIIRSVIITSVLILLSGCSSDNNGNVVTETPVPTKQTNPETTSDPMITESIDGDNATPIESQITDMPSHIDQSNTDTPTPSEPEITETPAPIEGENEMPTGKWYDKNGNTVLEFKGNKMYATWWSGMEKPDEYDVVIEKTDYATYINNANGEYGTGFLVMSHLRIMDDGSLSAYEEILDGESHSYKFVPEDKIEEERAVKDFSTDMPKVIESKEIKRFALYLNHYYIEALGSGSYSWEINKKTDGTYISRFEGMGPSYVIIQYNQEVDNSYIDGLLKLLEEEKVAEKNGMFFSNDRNDVENSLYITFESREKIYIGAGSKAMDKWPIDNEKFINYAMSIIPSEELN